MIRAVRCLGKPFFAINIPSNQRQIETKKKKKKKKKSAMIQINGYK